MQNSNYAVIITGQLGYIYPYPAKRDCIFAKEIIKNRITFWMFCIQISVTFSNQTISTSIICVSVLVGILINIQKQNMINNFHARVKTGKLMTLIPTLPFNELWVVFMEHWQRVWHANREHLPFQTPGFMPPFWDLCSTCWDQIPRIWYVFPRFSSSITPWYFLDFAYRTRNERIFHIIYHICLKMVQTSWSVFPKNFFSIQWSIGPLNCQFSQVMQNLNGHAAKVQIIFKSWICILTGKRNVTKYGCSLFHSKNEKFTLSYINWMLNV